jgi:hypothetical protein
MEIEVPISAESQIDFITMQKMVFIFNAIQDGWCVRKSKNKYVFTKGHGGAKEVYLDSYLKQFIADNLDLSKVNKI